MLVGCWVVSLVMVECKFNVEVEAVVGVEGTRFQPRLWMLWELIVLTRL